MVSERRIVMSKNLPMFRYVVMDLTDNYALQVEFSQFKKVGEKFFLVSPADRKTHEYRVLRIEGTVYNKDPRELRKEALA